MPDFEFGSRLNRLRKDAGLTQAQLGGRIGVTARAVSQWENGRTEPALSLLGKLADALGVTLEVLLQTAPQEKKSVAT